MVTSRDHGDGLMMTVPDPGGGARGQHCGPSLDKNQIYERKTLYTASSPHKIITKAPDKVTDYYQQF